jgi:hypothetical protein
MDIDIYFIDRRGIVEILGVTDLTGKKRLELERAARPFGIKLVRRPWALCLPVLDSDGCIDERRLAALGASQDTIAWIGTLIEWKER